MSNYAPDDLNQTKAIKGLEKAYSVLTWVEWYMCGKNDEMADHINQTLRDEIQKVIDELSKSV